MPEPIALPRAVEFAIAGARMLCDPAGALYWPKERALVLADLHLEKGAAFAARGVPLPPYDTPETLGIVERVLAHYRPKVVIALGDSFHRADSHRYLTPEVHRRLRKLTAACDWFWVAGNHDPEPPTGLGGEWVRELPLGPVMFRHEPRPGEGRLEIAGHLHPVAKLCLRGRVLRRRCFVLGQDRVVMPAMGAYAGGLNVLDPAFAPVFPEGFRAYVLGARGVYPMAPSRLSLDAPTVQPRLRAAG